MEIKRIFATVTHSSTDVVDGRALSKFEITVLFV